MTDYARIVQEASEQLRAVIGYPVDSLDTGIGALAKEREQQRARAEAAEAAFDAHDDLLHQVIADRDGCRQRAETAERRCADWAATASRQAERIDKLTERLAVLDRLSATGTAESFLQCDDETKKFVFADWIEESARRKKAERERDEAREAIEAMLRCPEIADCDPADKDEETHHAERFARAFIAKIDAAGIAKKKG